jgi:hypothetical protein
MVMIATLSLTLVLWLGAPAEAAECVPETPVASASADLRLAAAAVAGARSAARIELERLVARILREEGDAGPWSAHDGMCLDLAALWMERLRLAGVPARIATVDPGRRAEGTPVARGMEGKFHAFVLIEVPGGEPIIVDGSWRQFIQGAEHLPGLPEVFVGTFDELVLQLGQQRSSLRIEIHDDPLLGRRDPRETAQLAYGAGPWAGLRELLPSP